MVTLNDAALQSTAVSKHVNLNFLGTQCNTSSAFCHRSKKTKIMTTDSLFFDMHPVPLCSLCLAETRSKTVASSCCVGDTSSTSQGSVKAEPASVHLGMGCHALPAGAVISQGQRRTVSALQNRHVYNLLASGQCSSYVTTISAS